MRASRIGSNGPLTDVSGAPGNSGAIPTGFGTAVARAASLVLMILPDLDVIEGRNGVIGKHRRRAVERDQIGS